MRRKINISIISVVCVVFFGGSIGFAGDVINPSDFSGVRKTSNENLKPPMQEGFEIGPEDVLEISVWKNPDLSRTVVVRPDGRISMPLIGDVKAAGLTPDELRQAIVAKLQEYQETVLATVIVKEINSYKVFILGEVRTPGTIILKRKTTVLQAIAQAGGFTEFASENRIVLIRDNRKTTISFRDLVRGKSSDGDIILKTGDTIYVP